MLLNFNLQPGEERYFNLTANFAYVNSASGPIELRAENGEPVLRRGGQGIKRREVFSILYIKNMTGAVNTVELDVVRVDTWELLNDRASVDQGSSPWLTRQNASSSAQLINVVVGLAAASLTGAPSGNRTVNISNVSASTIYIGPAGVTTATGINIPAGSEREINECNWEVFGIAASSGNNVRVLVQRD